MATTYDDYRDASFQHWGPMFQRVPDSLEPWVEWIVAHCGRGVGSGLKRPPEGIVHLICLLTGDSKQPEARPPTKAALVLSGAHIASHPMLLGAETLVAQLRPGAARVILGIPAEALRGHVVSADLIWGSPAADALELIQNAASLTARLTIFTEFLQSRVVDASIDDTFAVRAAAWMQLHRGRFHLSDLVERTGYSERQVRRRFSESVGVSPKAYAQTLRLRTVLRVGRSGADWARIADEAGYYDQSHMVHEFKTALGVPPTVFFARSAATALSRFGILVDG